MKHDGLIEEKFEDGTKFLISSKGIIKLSQLKTDYLIDITKNKLSLILS